MPSLDDWHADVEADRRSRESEIRLLERLAKGTRVPVEAGMLRRSLVMVTYAHLEGFSKFVLFAYASFINSSNIACNSAAVPIAAASLGRVFAALRNPESKHDFFRRRMPEDAKLHLVAREHTFVEKYDEVFARKVNIPDSFVDTKSNLSADVLRKLLFQLGLPFSGVDPHQATMDKLLGVRNAIARGDRLYVPTDNDVNAYIVAAMEIMAFLQSETYSAINTRQYLKNAI
jgi:hypothetical protein